jgi:hypothetical protein
LPDRAGPPSNDLSPGVDRPNGTHDVESPRAGDFLAWASQDAFLVPVRGYDKGFSPENVEFVGIAARLTYGSVRGDAERLDGPRSTHRACVQPDEVFGAFHAGEFVRPGAPKDEQREALT